MGPAWPELLAGSSAALDPDAIRATLRTVASCAPGSEIALGYLATEEFLDPVDQEFIATEERLITAAVQPT